MKNIKILSTVLFSILLGIWIFSSAWVSSQDFQVTPNGRISISAAVETSMKGKGYNGEIGEGGGISDGKDVSLISPKTGEDNVVFGFALCVIYIGLLILVLEFFNSKLEKKIKKGK